MTVDDVAARFAEAVETGRRLPRVRVQGYFNVWPAFARDQWEAMDKDDHHLPRIPPDPRAIERMMETMRWVQWLEVEQRHLVWMRARQYEWKDICRRFGCCTKTAFRRWKTALQFVVDRLDEANGNAGQCRATAGNDCCQRA